MILSNCAICDSKKSRFLKNEETKGLLSNLGVKTQSSKVPILGDILMCIKMNEIINKFVLAGENCMSQMHLKQPGFTYSTYGPFTKNKEKNKKLKEIGDISTKINLIRHAFSMTGMMTYRDFKDLARRTASDKVLRGKALNIAKNPKYDGYQRGLASVIYKCFDRKSKGSGANIPLESNEELAEELHKPIIKKFKKRTVYSGFKDNIWGADLAHMQLISKFNKGFRFLLCVIDIFSKYAWVVPLKDKKGVSIVNAFQ